MAFEIIMPKLGLTMKTGTIVKWMKNEGDHVDGKEPLIEIETEKLSHEIESPASGILLKKLAVVGEKYEIACVLGYVGDRDEKIPAGTGVSEAPAAAAPPTPETAAPQPPIQGPRERVFISPLARKLSASMGIDYRQIQGTGPNGRIVKADVLRFAEKPPAQQHSAADVTVPYAGMRRAIGENMSAANLAAPMVTYSLSTDVSALISLRTMLNSGVTEKSESVSVNDLIMKICAAALMEMPVMNSTLTDAGITRHATVNMGMATAIDGGLLVPVIRGADKKSLLSISKEAKDIALRARTGKLLPDELHGGTFTVSNIGGYNSVDFFTPIINAPQAAILGVGRIADKITAVNGEAVVRPMMGLSLTCDHRVIDGAVAAEFLAVLLRLLENPVRAVI